MLEIKPANREDAKAILTHPEIYETITSDGAPPIDEYEPAPAVYVGGYLDGKIIGLFVFHPKSQIWWQLHIQVLPEYRPKYASKFAREGLKWFWANSEVYTLCAEIPSLYTNVINFSLKQGWRVDGRIDDAYLKHGKLYSVYYLSTNRPIEPAAKERTK